MSSFKDLRGFVDNYQEAGSKEVTRTLSLSIFLFNAACKEPLCASASGLLCTKKTLNLKKTKSVVLSVIVN